MHQLPIALAFALFCLVGCAGPAEETPAEETPAEEAPAEEAPAEEAPAVEPPPEAPEAAAAPEGPAALTLDLADGSRINIRRRQGGGDPSIVRDEGGNRLELDLSAGTVRVRARSSDGGVERQVGGNPSCAAGSTCEFFCPAGGCLMACAEGATCTGSCAGGGCTQTCATGADCTWSCTGGGCS